MTDLRSQKALSARIMKCGVSRVWFDPARISDIAEAITSDDIRKLVGEGVISALPKSGTSSYRAKRLREQKRKGRRKGKGSRKGSLETRARSKKAWMKRIRSIRRLLRELREQQRIDGTVYRDIYVKSKSGLFRSKSHVMIYLERNNMLRAADESVQAKKK